MKIYVATYDSSSGCPAQKVFKTRKEADIWLRKKFNKDFDENSDADFQEWKTYGSWTAKIKSYFI